MDRVSATSSHANLGDLLEETSKFLNRFVVFASPHQAVAVTLWVAHTHAIKAADATPYLAVTSPEKQSGKTRLQEVLELLVRHPWRAVRPSEAVVFRKIDADRSTLLLDEVDAIFKDRSGTYEGLRAMLNAGHRRGARVPRCEGRSGEIKECDVFGAKALAGIGDLPDTVADRSIPIRLARRARHEPVEKFRYRQARTEARPLKQNLARWAQPVIDTLRGAHPQIPDALSDRAADGWEPLFAIADAAGGEWPRVAREAAVALHGDPAARNESAGVMLLRAIRRICKKRRVDRISTKRLLKALIKRDEGPWAAWWEEAISRENTKGPGARLSQLLRPYGIRPKPIRIDEKVTKGYELADFKDAFSRYLSHRPNGDTKIQNKQEKGAPTTSEPRSNTACNLVTSLASQEGKSKGKGSGEMHETAKLSLLGRIAAQIMADANIK